MKTTEQILVGEYYLRPAGAEGEHYSYNLRHKKTETYDRHVAFLTGCVAEDALKIVLCLNKVKELEKELRRCAEFLDNDCIHSDGHNVDTLHARFLLGDLD